MPAHSKPVTINVLPREQFETAMFDHLNRTEDKSGRIYSDSKGIPTIGYGTALAVKGSDGKFALHEHYAERLKTATGKPALVVTAEEKKRLDDAVAALNKGDPARAKELIPAFSKTKETSENNKFSFEASSDGMKNVALGDINKAKASALKDIETAAKGQGKSPRQIEALKSQFENSKEMITLASFKYNAGVNAKMPNTATALVTGNRAEAAFEMMYRSNKGKDRGLANRRASEASIIVKTFNDEEKAAYEKLLKDRATEVSAYQSRIGRKIGLAGEKGAAPEPSKKPDGGGLSEDRNALRMDIGRNDGPGAELSLKNGADLTKAEVRQIMEKRVSLPDGPEKNRLVRLEKEHFKTIYGTDPVRTDWAGRAIPAGQQSKTNGLPRAARASSGESLADAMIRLGNTVAASKGSENAAAAGRDLQTGLNIIRAGAGENAPLFDTLKIDGKIGPKTRHAARTALAKLAPGMVENGFALGQFKNIARRSGGGAIAPEKLRHATSSIFGPLFRGPKEATPKASHEGLGLQAALNDIGTKIFPRERFVPLKEDGVIGPVTSGAFVQVNRATRPDRLVSSLGDNLGLFSILPRKYRRY